MPPPGKVLRPIGDESRRHSSPSLNCERISTTERIEFYKRELAEAHEEMRQQNKQINVLRIELYRKMLSSGLN
ncbi:hypothetical protein KIN20_037281 [Parelaphostrongylus tenuis]|uniref:Uncharacterized protein n=1 Tax=Parelaphostrongylus tenuis TaxID=148309 RepID=A0AAD5WMC1_PARTN|nr:hypothetical protein KIN20_037281 [Parelaphostrongylus tenuis]